MILAALRLVVRMKYPNAAYSYSLGDIALELPLRIVVVAFVLSAYLCLGRLSHLPVTITRQSAHLATRALQHVLIASNAYYALIAEKMARSQSGASPFPAQILCIAALGTVASALLLRKNSLRPANDGLRLHPDDVKALTQWRKITTMSLGCAMAVGLYGFILRSSGDSHFVAWPFFLASVGLLLMWKPRLPEAS